MSTPGDPFDPSLVPGFGQRDPNFLPAPIFTGLGQYADLVYAALVLTDRAWSVMNLGLKDLAEAKQQIEAVVATISQGRENRDIINVQRMLSSSGHDVFESRDVAHQAYKDGLAHLRRVRGY